jgi:soluble cytochrome b562
MKSSKRNLGKFIFAGLILPAILITSQTSCALKKKMEERDRRTFGDAIINADGDLGKAKRRFTAALKPFQNDQPGDKAELRKAFEQFQKVLSDAKSATAKLKVPDSPDCKDLAKAFEQFLGTEDRVVAKELADILQQVEATPDKLGLLAKLKIVGSLKKCSEAEDPDRKSLEKAAKAFDEEQKRRGYV